MARTDLTSDYQLDSEHLTPEQLKRALSGDLDGFRYFFEHCMQLQDKETRQLIHPKLNKGQELIADTILRHVAKDTRAEVHKEIVIAGPRQFGKSTLITAISNYMAAYVSGLERSNIIHTLQTSGAASKYYNQKMAPIVTGVHPDIFPTINRKSENNSTQLFYKDVKGIPRGSYYEILSAGSNSVRSGTATVWLCDEPSEYRNPDVTEDAISGALPDHGFSFTAYIGTFSDRISSYFTDKIQMALDNPKEMELVFVPWFLVYGGEEDILNFTEDDYNEYDKNVILPELVKYGYTGREALGKIAWYHRRARRTSHMRYEFPTSIDDIMALTKDRCFFSEEVRKMQEPNVIAGTPMTLKVDQFTKKPEMEKTDQSAFIVYKQPQDGHRYRIAVDAITSMSGESDYFSMMVFDEKNNEQCAVFYENGLALEDYADYAVQIAKIYNRAMIVPEQNMAEGFIALVWEGQRYYNFYFQDNVARARKMPGIRTTASSRTAMLDSLTILLETGRIILHDQATLDEMGYFERKVKKRQDGTESVRIEARAGHHDDRVSNLWIYAGSLDKSQIAGNTNKVGWSIL